MTTPDAIKAIERLVKYPKTPIGLHTLKALQLSQEALKRHKYNTARVFLGSVKPLPGETKE